MQKYKDTLYIKDQLNKIREWTIYYDNNSYVTKYGILRGELIETTIIINKGKNIGKSNETSISQQILKEVESNYKNYLKKGYKSLRDLGVGLGAKVGVMIGQESLESFLNRELHTSKTDNNGNFKPMLANKTHTIALPAFCQPKINGVRCNKHIKNVDNGIFGTTEQIMFLSREGIEYEIEHLANILKNLSALFALDGELYVPGEIVTSIGGAARNKNNPLHKKLCYIIFDLAIDEPQYERLIDLECIIGNDIIHLTKKQFCQMNIDKSFEPKVYIIPSILVEEQEQITELTTQFLQYGFEGSIVRDYNATYKFGQRTKYMRKYKKFDDAEFLIVDVIPYEKDPYLAKIICRNDINDLMFETIPIGNKEIRHNYLVNKEKYIGKLATVKFYERSIYGLPFHSNLIGIRDYE